MKITEKIIPIIAILAIIILESQALYYGIDGMLFSICIGAIAGISGYEVRGMIR